MKKTHDYIHYYRGYWSDGGRCRIRRVHTVSCGGGVDQVSFDGGVDKIAADCEEKDLSLRGRH